MGIFGNLDTDEIPDDPFFIAAGVYPAICTDMKEYQKNDGSTSIVVSWCIEDGGEYHGAANQQWLPLPDLENRSEEDLTPDERASLSRIKLLLMQGFDVPRDELNTVEYSDLIGTKVFITIKNSTKGTKTYTNVVDVLSERLMAEKSEEVSGTMGI